MSNPSRNLVIVHSEGWQDLDDLKEIAALVTAQAPDIEVFLVSNDTAGSVTRRRAAERPSLIFSPIRLNAFRPMRGKILAGRAMPKLEEMTLLRSAGLPVPDFEEARPDSRPDSGFYGRYILQKPSHAFASWGQGIELFRTEDWRYCPPGNWPEGHPGRKGPMILQRFIDCGHAMSCRVLTILGRPIFTYCRRSTREMRLEEITRRAFEQADFMPAMPHSEASVNRDPDILALAAAAYAAMPDIPLQACDILRDRDGRLHLLEINPGGGTWMFSNRFADGYRQRLGVSNLKAIFDAPRVCAEALIGATREQAC